MKLKVLTGPTSCVEIVLRDLSRGSYSIRQLRAMAEDLQRKFPKEEVGFYKNKTLGFMGIVLFRIGKPKRILDFLCGCTLDDQCAQHLVDEVKV